MITLKTNANATINKMVYENGVRAFYIDVCEKYTNGYVQTFITSTQNLITKLGIIVSKVSTQQTNISYCAQSITYLCSKVLDNPSLENTFDSIGLNDKGNHGKHDIVTNKIDMDRCVSTYNNLVNSIANKYNLHALKAMVVSKRAGAQKNVQKNNTPKQSPKQAPKPKVNHNANEAATNNDERLRLHARLERGDGRYNKGIFNKRQMVNFKLTVSIDNPDDLKIQTVIATFKCGKNTVEKKISKMEDSTTEIDLPTSEFSGNIEASVVVTYKIGLFKTKQIKATVSKNF